MSEGSNDLIILHEGMNLEKFESKLEIFFLSFVIIISHIFQYKVNDKKYRSIINKMNYDCII